MDRVNTHVLPFRAMQSDDRDLSSSKPDPVQDPKIGHSNVDDLRKNRAWDIKRDVLSTKGFPLAGLIRTYQPHTCASSGHGQEDHRDLFEFNRTLGKDVFHGKITALPEIQVCWNGSSLFEDKLPRARTGSYGKRCLFEDLPLVGNAISALFGTYWYIRLVKDKRAELRLYCLLAGTWDTKNIEELRKMPLSPQGVGHLKQIVSTVDGMTMQLALAFPDVPEVQNWDYFDNAINCMLKHLLEDWCLDHGPEYVSFYEKLKSIRGQIKQVAFHATRSIEEIRVPRDMTFLRLPLSKLVGKSLSTLLRVSLMIQTRACGTPPPHMFLKTFKKFRETLTAPCPIPDRKHLATIAFATKVVYTKIVETGNIPGNLTNFLSKAKISLSDSAELSVGHHEGGKYEAFRLFSRSLTGRPVEVINLQDGKGTGKFLEDVPENMGTRAFHASLGMFTREEIPDLMTVRSEAVLEPGKVRQITVSESHHAMLLHPISHVLLDILKLVPSSESGTGAAHHAFNFYKRLTARNPAAEFIFEPTDLWVLSSDLETATDYANPWIVKTILQVFMGPRCLGVPDFYRNLVTYLLTEPRLVINNKTNEEFRTTRGCLMGDPVTKFAMHMMHLVAKEVTLKLMA
jgi:hypothetical protein